MIVVDFKTATDITHWVIVDDVVMGGRSNSSFSINKEGHAVFQGIVSLENNGGFSSVRNRFLTINVEEFTSVSIRIKGDGNTFQCRVKTNAADQYSYVAVFNTTAEWTTVEIPFNSMYPSFRGQKLATSNYPGMQMEEISFLIANKKAGRFTLEIDRIWLA
jgi:hypothetical protein